MRISSFECLEFVLDTATFYFDSLWPTSAFDKPEAFVGCIYEDPVAVILFSRC